MMVLTVANGTMSSFSVYSDQVAWLTALIVKYMAKDWPRRA